MKELAIRIGLALLLNLPAAGLFALAVLVTRHLPRRLTPVPSDYRARNRRLSVAIWSALSFALVLQVTGSAMVGTRWEPLSRIISIYPGSAVFYLIPTRMTDLIPEPALAFLGAGSALFVSMAAAMLLFVLWRWFNIQSAATSS